MADDLVKVIREQDVQEECILISLDYNLIDYIEKNYPDIHTGFLLFTAFGDSSRLNCDYLGLEEESATESAIDATHDQNKKLLVWTPNEKETQKHFLCSDADGLITDNVKQAAEVEELLEQRSDLQRMVDWIMAAVG
ncbi:MAG: hypothetical protein IJI20_04290 [Firmicutes bacterium]|nr:hypothetical protein [Bacillota bacterium]